MNWKIFGLFVLVTFSQIGIYNTEAKLIIRIIENYMRNARAGNSTTQVETPGGNNSFFEWFFGLWGQKPTTITTTTTTTRPSLIVTTPEACPSCKCGFANTRRRIIGGVVTKENRYPWMILLLRGERAICGGSLINDRYVLTAAHCVSGYDASRFIVRIGEHDKSSAIEAITQDFKVERVIVHASYRSVNFDNDIALLKLRGVVGLYGSMRPVCLAEKGLTYSGEKGIVAGWGTTHIGGPLSDKLRESIVPILSNKECRSTRHRPEQITDNMMCAGYLTGGSDSCQGDSGGPIHVVEETSEIHRLVGIVSWGEECGLPNYPGVYTRANRYLSWIYRHTSDACYCQ